VAALPTRSVVGVGIVEGAATFAERKATMGITSPVPHNA
jgi:hypothetical protein